MPRKKEKRLFKSENLPPPYHKKCDKCGEPDGKVIVYFSIDYSLTKSRHNEYSFCNKCIVEVDSLLQKFIGA